MSGKKELIDKTNKLKKRTLKFIILNIVVGIFDIVMIFIIPFLISQLLFLILGCVMFVLAYQQYTIRKKCDKILEAIHMLRS